MTRSISAQIAALPSLPIAELRERYEALHGHPPPVKDRQWIWRRVAWAMQAEVHGGISDRAQTRLDKLVADFEATHRRGQVAQGIRPAGSITPGTILEKRYNGRDLVVRVLDDGFELDGVVHATLTAAAKAVTGSKAINGRLFFGLTKRSRDQ